MNLDSSYMMVDLETVPEDARIGMTVDHAPGWERLVVKPEAKMVPGNYKTADAISNWRAKELTRYQNACASAMVKAHEKANAEWKKGSLNAMKGRIIAIAYSFGEEEPAVIECPEDERFGLQTLNAMMDTRQPRHIVAHHGHGFDFPWLMLRSMRHGLYPLANVFFQEKPWDERLLDTKLMWPTIRGLTSSSLANTCAFLGIDHSEGNPIDGSMVLDAYLDGRYGDICRHGLADIRDLRLLFKTLKQVRGM
tara:strand:+ start:439 stop:1191 length:753 start_codon:yes stop_codon:yes gene_type:complete